MARTYGTLHYEKKKDMFVLDKIEPHVSIKLKSIFHKVSVTSIAPYWFNNLPDICMDLIWFMERYPLIITGPDLKLLKRGKERYLKTIADLEAIHLPDYQPKPAALINGYTARHYQLTGAETYLRLRRLLLGDDIGLGKTLTGILSLLDPKTLPAIVSVQTHLANQWKKEGIEEFTNLKCHIIKGTKVYDLPPADVYIIRYTCLAGWVDIFSQFFFRSAIFDEAQELRRVESKKYDAAKVLSECVTYCQGMTATPIYNYGDEIYNILNLINPGCLGSREQFLREWCTPIGNNKHKVMDPQALGAYLRENFLFLRRTRKEVGRELPPVNKIIHTVDYDIAMVKENEQLAIQLAMKVRTGTFSERGEAARALDMLARRVTGVSKARYVAEYVKFLLENELPIVLAGWHRDVYDIWLKELADYNPAMYTGSETPKEKDEAKRRFISGETKLFIISLRSGIGLDGLQFMCHDIVIGELDWSPEVLKQLIGRVDRDGVNEMVNAHYLVSDEGSDPPIVNLLGLKSSQAEGIINPLQSVAQQFTDESRIKLLADHYLKKKEKELPF